MVVQFRVYHFLILYVIVTTALLTANHSRVHGSWFVQQSALAFFCSLNFLICLWEIALGWHIDLIKTNSDKLKKQFKTNVLGACIDFFLLELELSNILSGRFWSRVWSTYSLYDPSYANKESFGFFVDVGNGWTTIIPTILFCFAMTYHDLFSPRWIGRQKTFKVTCTMVFLISYC